MIKYLSISKFRSLNNLFTILIFIVRSKAGKAVIISVKSSTKLQKLHCILIGKKGKLTKFSKSKIHKTKTDITFNAESWMIPEVQVFVYYIHETGEIIYDHLSVAVHEKFTTQVSNLTSSDHDY